MQEWAQNVLRKGTNGQFLPGHPVYGEPKPDGSYDAEGQMTKGAGFKENPSIPTLPNPIDPRVQDQNQPQARIPFKEKFLLPPGATKGPIPGSAQKLADPEIKAQLDKDHS